MTTELKAGLREPADRARTSSPPPDLWTRGVRRHRRRLAGAAAIALLVVVTAGGASGLLWDSSRQTQQPVSHPGDAAIPDRLVPPSPWTPGTDDEGPLGRLALVRSAERKSGTLGTSREGLVGVSADTGADRFLDLPGVVTDRALVFADGAVALAPDGRHLAYWLQGRAKDGGTSVAGVASYDTTTGQVVRTALPAGPKGDVGQLLAWVSPDTLAVQRSQVTDRTNGGVAARATGGLLWTPGPHGGNLLSWHPPGYAGAVTQTPTGFATLGDKRLYLWTDRGRALGTLRMAGVERSIGFASAGLAPDGRTLVASTASSTGELSSTLYSGRVRPGTSSVRMVRLGPPRSLDGSTVGRVLGWRDGRHVVVNATIGKVNGSYTVDLRTGAFVRQVVDPPYSNWGADPEFASDLWAYSTVARPAPPGVLDPRVRALLVLLGALAAGGLVLGAWALRRGRRGNRP